MDQAGTGATGDEEAKAGENSSGVEIIVPGDSQGLPLDTSHKSIQAFKTAHCAFFFGVASFPYPHWKLQQIHEDLKGNAADRSSVDHRKRQKPALGTCH